MQIGQTSPRTHVLFKEGAVNKNRRRTIPRPSTALLQVPPVLLHYSLREYNIRDELDLVDRTCYISSDGMYLVEQTDLVDQRWYLDRAGYTSS